MTFIGDNGQIYEFTFTPYSVYNPNKSSRCGYGSDEWFFVCYINSTYYLLHFEVSGECGGAWWNCKEISKNEVEVLSDFTKNAWCTVWYDNNKPCISHIHPENIYEGKNIIVPGYSRMGPLTDDNYRGF